MLKGDQFKVSSNMQSVLRDKPYVLSGYQRMREYFSVTQVAGQHLDQVNFDRRIFKRVLPLESVETMFEPEHGYMSPDVANELKSLVIQFERSRSLPGCKSLITERNYLDEAAVGIGSGVTGTLLILLMSIYDYTKKSKKTCSRDVIVFGPCYPGITSAISRAGLKPQIIMCLEAHSFLPSEDEITTALSSDPLAIVISLPSNPTLSYFGEAQRSTYHDLIDRCQKTGIFLVVDAVYQDSLHEEADPCLDLFGLSRSIDYLFKISGPSKDRPGMSGMRVGYYVGDPRIERFYKDNAASCVCSPNTLSVCIFAVDILFRLLVRNHLPLSIDALGLLHDHIAGCDNKIDRRSIYKRMTSLDIFRNYTIACAENRLNQSLASNTIAEECKSIDRLVIINGQCNGNLLFLRIIGDTFGLSCHEAFFMFLEKVRLGILPGNVFGFPIMPRLAFFRVTTTHDSPSAIVRNIRSLSSIL